MFRSDQDGQYILVGGGRLLPVFMRQMKNEDVVAGVDVSEGGK